MTTKLYVRGRIFYVLSVSFQMGNFRSFEVEWKGGVFLDNTFSTNRKDRYRDSEYLIICLHPIFENTKVWQSIYYHISYSKKLNEKERQMLTNLEKETIKYMNLK